jgi:exodeoxyribonuclease VII large subunit
MTLEFPVTDDGFSRDILTISQLNQAVGRLLEQSVPALWVRGEVSNFTQAASGHWYFSLKDRQAAVRAVMFRGRAAAAGFTPKPGDQVEARARVSLYEARGDFQLQVESLRRAGLGGLYEAFLRLKEKLAAEGLFDPARKRAPARLPRAIGVITALRAAAWRDVLSALARRAPRTPIVVYPAPVQGADAASKLAAQVAAANRRAEVDTLLLVRGGGSIEDLYSFNDEQLARAIAQSAIPVISGVGHETDFTIADFVADVRAPTPTAAAELACAPREQWLAGLDALHQRAARALRQRLDAEGQRIDWLTGRLGRPSSALAAERARLQREAQRLRHAAALRLERERARLARLADRLPAALTRQRESAHERLRRAEDRLTALDPRRVLERGYAWLQDPAGHPLTRAAQARPGQAVAATLADGQLDMTVQRARPGQVP